jgi:A/G-specific adenine glycosylase
MDSSRVPEGLDALAGHPHLDQAWKRRFQPRLRNWFKRNARDLPWRRTTDPYRIWVSEVMLQQTQVQTVIDYFNRFIDRFPNVGSLAEADEADVLRLWEGLGYYRRARQLHSAAQKVVQQHDAKFPHNVQDVYDLPGIGKYTAHAILCFSDSRRLPIVEANTQRLYARLMELDEPLSLATSQRKLWGFAEWILPQKDADQFNQALMEIGSLVCTPKAPNCAACPVRDLCPTRSSGRQTEVPVAKQKTAYESRMEIAWVIRNSQDDVLLRLCQADERWAGLWDFPRYFTGETSEKKATAASRRQLENTIHETIENTKRLCTIRHGVTKYRITLHVEEGSSENGNAIDWDATEPYRWIAVADLPELPLNQTARKIANMLG